MTFVAREQVTSLTANSGDRHINDAQAGRMVHDGASVRRLMPVECERLQGLPDHWTDPQGNAPDSRRYAALGDAVTANVSEWIGRRMVAA